MFKIGDRVVYPGHGVAQITQVVEKRVGTQQASFYELTFTKGEVILVPVGNRTMVRPLSSSSYVSDIMIGLSQPIRGKVAGLDHTINWKQRNKEYQIKIHSGDLKKISEIYKELKHMERHKELSYCEKGILEQTESLLVQEIALVNNFDESTATQILRCCFDGHSMV